MTFTVNYSLFQELLKLMYNAANQVGNNKKNLDKKI